MRNMTILFIIIYEFLNLATVAIQNLSVKVYVKAYINFRTNKLLS